MARCVGKTKQPVQYTRKGKTYTRMQMKCPPRTTPKRAYNRINKRGELKKMGFTKAELSRYYRMRKKMLAAYGNSADEPAPLVIPPA